MSISPLVIASHNEGKVIEIRELLTPFNITVTSAANLHLPEPEETGETFAANAAIKSQSTAQLSGHYALADDSGLCVPVLDGAPGVYSARWAGGGKDFSLAMERIRAELQSRNHSPEGAQAFFICVLALTSPSGKTHSFEGRVDGTLTFPPRGDKGFGYDPIFIPTGHQTTFAEMPRALKQEMSHRMRAFEKFTAYVQSHLLKGKEGA